MRGHISSWLVDASSNLGIWFDNRWENWEWSIFSSEWIFWGKVQFMIEDPWWALYLCITCETTIYSHKWMLHLESTVSGGIQVAHIWKVSDKARIRFPLSMHKIQVTWDMWVENGAHPCGASDAQWDECSTIQESDLGIQDSGACQQWIIVYTPYFLGTKYNVKWPHNMKSWA